MQAIAAPPIAASFVPGDPHAIQAIQRKGCVGFEALGGGDGHRRTPAGLHVDHVEAAVAETVLDQVELAIRTPHLLRGPPDDPALVVAAHPIA